MLSVAPYSERKILHAVTFFAEQGNVVTCISVLVVLECKFPGCSWTSECPQCIETFCCGCNIGRNQAEVKRVSQVFVNSMEQSFE